MANKYLDLNGLKILWDKIMSKLNSNSLVLDATNMDEALETGLYPLCTSGKPLGTTGGFTCITTKFHAENYVVIEQTAYGRSDELGQIYKRLIYIGDGEQEFGNWIRISV